MPPPSLPWGWGTPSLGGTGATSLPWGWGDKCHPASSPMCPQPRAHPVPLSPGGGPSVTPNPSVTSLGFTCLSWGSGGTLEGELSPMGACPTTGDFGIPWLGGCSHDMGDRGRI